MQLARDYSIQVYCRFYPEHESGTPLTTDHYRIGVFYHPYNNRSRLFPHESTHLPKNGRLPVSFWRHMVADEAYFAQPQGLEKSRYDEFDDYETAYGTTTPREIMRAYQPTGLPLFPLPMTTRANPETDPVGYVNDVIAGFVRFYEPGDALTRDDWNRYVDLNSSYLGAQYATGFGDNGDEDVISAMLNAGAQRLNPDDLLVGNRLLAQKIVERAVVAAKTPAELGVTVEGKKENLEYLDDYIARMLEVRKKYIATGDIAAQDEMFAGFDSKADPDEEVSKTPPATTFKFRAQDMRNLDVMIKKLRTFVDKSDAQPNELDRVRNRLRVLETKGNLTPDEKKEKFALSLRAAQLTNQGFVETRRDARTKIADAERSKLAIVQRLETLKRNIDTTNKLMRDARSNLERKQAALINAKGKTAEKAAQREVEIAESEVANLAERMKKNRQTQTEIEQKEGEVKQELLDIVKEVEEADEKAQTPVSVRVALQAKRGTELYERAVSLAMIDLVEKELAAMEFAREKSRKRAEDVKDAISTIENVRIQLPSGSVAELSRAVAGRGLLPFALSSTSSSLSVADMTTGYTPHAQTQVAISKLLRS